MNECICLGESDIHFDECELREIFAWELRNRHDDASRDRLIETDGGQSCADELKAADRSLFFGLFPRPRSPPPRTDGEAGPSTSGVSGAGDEVIDMDVDGEAEARAGGEAASDAAAGGETSAGGAAAAGGAGSKRKRRGAKRASGRTRQREAAE